ncbi:hypothetical protein [Actinophytocola sp.]|uniref:hypothetical protein n=1 Tax=Actinophytocola sp. TaxID=1872138 RepID=UPI003D6C14A7
MPGVGTMHHFTTRSGQRFGVLVEGSKHGLVVFGSEDQDTPSQTIVLEQDESDLLADVLHSRSIMDRLAELERRVDAVARNGDEQGGATLRPQLTG